MAGVYTKPFPVKPFLLTFALRSFLSSKARPHLLKTDFCRSRVSWRHFARYFAVLSKRSLQSGHVGPNLKKKTDRGVVFSTWGTMYLNLKANIDSWTFLFAAINFGKLCGASCSGVYRPCFLPLQPARYSKYLEQDMQGQVGRQWGAWNVFFSCPFSASVFR